MFASLSRDSRGCCGCSGGRWFSGYWFGSRDAYRRDALAWMLWVGGIGCGAGDVNAVDGDDVRRFVGL